MNAMSIEQKIGDWYHRCVYRKIASLTARVTDATDIALSDALLGSVVFNEVSYAAMAAAGYVVYHGISKAESVEESLAIGGAALLGGITGIVTITAVVGANYGINMLRTPLPEHLGLGEREIDQAAELRYTIVSFNRFGAKFMEMARIVTTSQRL